MATKQAISDLSDKIDNILTLLTGQSEELKKVNSKLTKALQKVEKLEGEVTSLTKRVTSLELENKRVKDELNTSAMASKSLSVRVLGVSSSDEETKSVDSHRTFFAKVYDRILKPVLTIATAKGELPVAPVPPNRPPLPTFIAQVASPMEPAPCHRLYLCLPVASPCLSPQ